MTGVGGGSLMTPLLVLLFGVHPVTAVGTDLLFAALTKSAGVVAHGFNRSVDWAVTGLLAAGSVPATAATLFVLSRIEAYGDAGRSIATILGWALIVTSISLLFRSRILAWAKKRFSETPKPRTRAIATVITGAVLGFVVSISSVGAGAIGMTVLLILYANLPLVRLVGSDIAHAVPLTLIAGAGYWWIGSVDLVLLGQLLAGSIPGILIGSLLAPRASERILRPLLAGVLALVGLKLALG
ncbi:sulfite exporter TauE/SafE family protein [Pinisolibacter sp.]|uniref:sulfite exporter TauE/SafE family protein n=1 Tax=Pinisolibacter sp. TaxID=2172024 RepID=UPI002FDE17D1